MAIGCRRHGQGGPLRRRADGSGGNEGGGPTLCFECFREGSERTRARQEAWAQRALPFEEAERPDRKLTAAEIAHRRRMLAYLEATTRRKSSA